MGLFSPSRPPPRISLPTAPSGAFDNLIFYQVILSLSIFGSLIEKLAVLVREMLEQNNRPADPHQPIDRLLHFRRKAEKREERVRLPEAA